MPQKYKIALVKQGKFNGGGVSSVCWFLYQTIFSAERYEVHLFSIETAYNDPINVRIFSPGSWFSGILTMDYTWHNIPVKHVGSSWSELEFQRYQPNRRLTELLNKFDLIQIVAGSPATANLVKDTEKPVCLFMATLARLERKTILEKESFLRKVNGHIMLPIVSSIEKRALRRADHVFAETEYTWQAIQSFIPASRVTIDTIGIDTQQFKPISEAERSDSYILSVGRFEDMRKNVTLLYEAYAILRGRLPDAPKLIIAGKTSPSPTAWSRARDLGIADHIIFKQGVSIDELISLYQNAAVYALSSNEEGLGIVLLESMACATPVVSTRCGGPDSVVSADTGFLTPVGDAHSLADRLQWMLQNPEQRRFMGHAGRRMVEARFSNEVVGKKYLDVYDKLINAEKH
jgi:D-inositol-3-phosphate glycosyltransferase